MTFLRSKELSFTEDSQIDTYDQKSLLVIENKLEMQSKMIYPRLKSVSTKYRHCEDANKLGTKAGQNLNIQKGIGRQTPNTQKKLLG